MGGSEVGLGESNMFGREEGIEVGFWVLWCERFSQISHKGRGRECL